MSKFPSPALLWGKAPVTDPAEREALGTLSGWVGIALNLLLFAAKLAAGTVAMNRVNSAFFAGDLKSVLNEQHQFPIGRRYDEDSLRAAGYRVAGPGLA